MSPYDVLGTHRGASDIEIRRAYRHKARTAHPDAGGKLADWLEIQRAHDLLVDPARRALYDEHGITAEAPPDMTRVKAMGQLSELFGKIVRADGIANIAEFDVVGALREAVRVQLDGFEKAEAALNRAKDRIAIMRGRFVTDKAGDNLFDGVLNAHLDQIATAETQLAEPLAVARMALELCADYVFKVDMPAQMIAQAQAMAQQGSTRSNQNVFQVFRLG